MSCCCSRAWGLFSLLSSSLPFIQRGRFALLSVEDLVGTRTDFLFFEGADFGGYVLSTDSDLYLFWRCAQNAPLRLVLGARAIVHKSFYLHVCRDVSMVCVGRGLICARHDGEPGKLTAVL